MIKVPEYRAFNTTEKRMYEVVMLEWSAALPNRLSRMALLSMDGLYTNRMVYGEETIHNNYELTRVLEIKDKNNRTVWEGDIVKALLLDNYGDNPEEVIEEVTIHEGLLAPFYMRVRFEEEWWKDHLQDGFEVIGNVYEHPKLLEKQ